MKRPLFSAAVVVLSGILCGLPETPGLFQASGGVLTLLIMFMFSKNRHAKRGLFFVALLALFLLAWIRAGQISELANSAEHEAFCAKYRASNEGGFDYLLYLRSLGIYSEKDMQKEDLLNGPLQEGDPPFFKAIKQIRLKASDNLDSSLHPRDSGFLKAVLLGRKKEMDAQLKLLYQRAGIAHLLAVSGLHVSLLGNGLYAVLRKKLSTAAAGITASLSVMFYCLLAGASVSAIRAAMMLTLSYLAVHLGRDYDLRSALCLALSALILVRPYYVFQGGFQLSFAAVSGICISEELRFSKKAGLLMVPLLIQAATLPILAYHYFFVPLYAVILNFLVIPLLAPAMVCGFFLMIGSGALPLLSHVFSFPVHYICLFYEYLCRLSMKAPASSICVGRPSEISLLLYYLALLLMLCLLRFRKTAAREGRRKKLSVFLCIIGAVILTFAARGLKRKEERFAVSVLDAGQGSCLFVQTGSIKLLFDAGSGSKLNFGEKELESFLLSRGITLLDAMIVSHADSDHTNAVLWLLGKDSRVKLRRLLLPQAGRTHPAYEELKRICEASPGTELAYLEEGDVISQIVGAENGEQQSAAQRGGEGGIREALRDGADETGLFCIYEGALSEETNRHSPLLVLRHRELNLFMSGDMEGTEEEMLYGVYRSLGKLPLIQDGVRLTLAAHHGSSGSNTEAAFSLFAPDAGIASCGRNNPYGHPHKEIRERFADHGSMLITTADNGQIDIVYAGDKIQLNSFLNGPAGSIGMQKD